MLRFQDEQLFGDTGFERSGKVVIARAPARLDVMGGIADYWGANVAALTLERGAVIGCQVRGDRQLRTLSLGMDGNSISGLRISVDDFYVRGHLKSYDQIRQLFAQNSKTAWGCVRARRSLRSAQGRQNQSTSSRRYDCGEKPHPGTGGNCLLCRD